MRAGGGGIFTQNGAVCLMLDDVRVLLLESGITCDKLDLWSYRQLADGGFVTVPFEELTRALSG